jgi:hypothetical protein
MTRMAPREIAGRSSPCRVSRVACRVSRLNPPQPLGVSRRRCAQVLPPGLSPYNAGYDPSCIEAVALKTLMSNFEAIAASEPNATRRRAHLACLVWAALVSWLRRRCTS